MEKRTWSRKKITSHRPTRLCLQCNITKKAEAFPNFPEEHVCRACRNAKRRADEAVAKAAFAALNPGAVLRCHICDVVKPVSQFSQSDQRRCKPCNAVRNRKLRTGNGPGRYISAEQIARRRNCPFTLSRDVYASLISNQCIYCDGPLPQTGMGLDQMVPMRGYTTENAVPCCEQCNRIKADIYTYDEMLLIGAAVRRVRQDRVTQGKALPQYSRRGRPRLHHDT